MRHAVSPFGGGEDSNPSAGSDPRGSYPAPGRPGTLSRAGRLLLALALATGPFSFGLALCLLRRRWIMAAVYALALAELAAAEPWLLRLAHHG